MWSLIDYMHCVLEGVVKRLLHLWTTTRGKPYSIPTASMKLLDDRLLKICPPEAVGRLPRSISDNLEHLKGEQLSTDNQLR